MGIYEIIQGVKNAIESVIGLSGNSASRANVGKLHQLMGLGSSFTNAVSDGLAGYQSGGWSSGLAGVYQGFGRTFYGS